MNIILDPPQVLLLWKMIFSDYAPTFSDMKPDIGKSGRIQLKDAGLIDYVVKKKPNGRKANHVILTDYALDWAVQNLDAKISDNSSQSGPVLQSVLAKLDIYLRDQNIPLNEILNPTGKGNNFTELSDSSIVSHTVKTATSLDIANKIRNAYFKVTGGQTQIRVKLIKIRQLLTEIPRKAIDESLHASKIEEKILLFPLENPQEISKEDESAALFDSGRINHIIIIED